jgi:agmatine deiminase
MKKYEQKKEQIKKKRNITIGLVQMSMLSDKNSNIEKAISLTKKAVKQGAQIICFPELFNTLYFPQVKHAEKEAHKLSEKIPGPTTNIFSKLAKELNVVIIIPIYELGNDKKYYNTAVVVDVDGNIVGKYRKMHIPHDPLFWEQNYFEKGNLGFCVVKTKYANISPLICFDQWFPEAARINTLKGADIIFYPTAIGNIVGYAAPDDWHDSWETVQRSHSIANGVHVAAINRVGVEDKLQFWGQSFITDAFGKVLKRASSKNEEVVVCTINLENNTRIKEGWGFIRNRRHKEYHVLTKKHN